MLWLVSFWSSEQFTGLEVENTPGMNRIKTSREMTFNIVLLCLCTKIVLCNTGKLFFKNQKTDARIRHLSREVWVIIYWSNCVVVSYIKVKKFTKMSEQDKMVL